jgi:elongator complex protein 3
MRYSIDIPKEKYLLLPLFQELLSKPISNERIFHTVLIHHPASDHSLYTKGQLRMAFLALIHTKELYVPKGKKEHILSYLVMKKVRSISGVTPVTVFTKPFPCPGKCIFCPTDNRYPKSYLASEPGVQRALCHKYDPYNQTYSRLSALSNIGHPTEKIELIILGGTWSSYPIFYQYWFIKRCFDALNDFCRHNQRPIPQKPLEIEPKIFSQAVESELIISQKRNEKAESRLVGLVIETRPDRLSIKECINLRFFGVTKIQIGIQSTDSQILRKNKRGHTMRQVYQAFRLMRQFGFKIHIHIMPNLYGSNTTKDIQSYKKLFFDKRLKPDEVKIYPCSLIRNTELVTYFQKKHWKPYTDLQLRKVLTACYVSTPRYARISRMIRDIPKQEILIGNISSNFRQRIEADIIKHKLPCNEIRFREIKDDSTYNMTMEYHETKYQTTASEEYFLEYTNDNGKILGFLRLSIPQKKSIIDELENHAIIRELHVYGPSTNIGMTINNGVQHKGIGKSLIIKAIEKARSNHNSHLSVISAVGTREYYRLLGFIDGKLYQHKKV